jgi:hypothetical protein
MGLISINGPLSGSTGEALAGPGEIFDDIAIITAITDTESIRLFYKADDPRDKIEKLLDENDIDDKTKRAIMQLLGIDATSDAPYVLADNLPGISLKVKHPVTGNKDRLYDVIISLNDNYKWTREKIAEWIENVCDVKDIAFKIPEGVKDEAGELSAITGVVKIKRLLPG